MAKLNIRPLGDKVIVQRVDAEETTAGGIVLPDSAKEKPKRGVVLAVGNGRLLDDGSRSEMQVKKNDEAPASWPHGGIGALVVNRLVSFLGGKPLGLVCDSSQGFDLPTGDTVEPDVAFVSNERCAAIPRPVRGFLRVVPDLVVEILSPSTKGIDQKQKKRIYERNGVREYWLMDPVSRSVRQLILTEKGYDQDRVCSDRDTLTSVVLAGFRIPVAELFPVFPGR